MIKINYLHLAANLAIDAGVIVQKGENLCRTLVWVRYNMGKVLYRFIYDRIINGFRQTQTVQISKQEMKMF